MSGLEKALFNLKVRKGSLNSKLPFTTDTATVYSQTAK
jgi:hypothetical protein